MKQYEYYTEKYGEGSVALSNSTTEDGFAEDWGDMQGDDIQIVALNFHGDSRTVELHGSGEVLSSAGSFTNETKREALFIGDLPSPEGNVEDATLQLNSCHSFDDLQFTDGTPTVGEVFRGTTNFKVVRGSFSGVSYWDSGMPHSSTLRWKKMYKGDFTLSKKVQASTKDLIKKNR